MGGVEGIWKEIARSIAIVNVYSSCDLVQKKRLWEELIRWKANCIAKLVVVVGGFNSVRRENEIRGAMEV